MLCRVNVERIAVDAKIIRFIGQIFCKVTLFVFKSKIIIQKIRFFLKTVIKERVVVCHKTVVTAKADNQRVAKSVSTFGTASF